MSPALKTIARVALTVSTAALGSYAFAIAASSMDHGAPVAGMLQALVGGYCASATLWLWRKR